MVSFISTNANEHNKVIKYNNIFEESLQDLDSKVTSINLVKIDKNTNGYFTFIKEFCNEPIVFYDLNVSDNCIYQKLKQRKISEVNIIHIGDTNSTSVRKSLKDLLVKNNIKVSFDIYKSQTEMMLNFVQEREIRDICILNSEEINNKPLMHSLVKEHIFMVPFRNEEEYICIREFIYEQNAFYKIYVVDEKLKENGENIYRIKENVSEYAEFVLTFLRDDYEFYNSYVSKNKNVQVIDMWNVKDKDIDKLKNNLIASQRVSIISDIYTVFDDDFQKEELKFLEDVYTKLEIDNLNKIENERLKKEAEEKRKKEDKRLIAENTLATEEMYVINKVENEKVYIYEKANYNSKVIGYMYGSLAEIQLIEKGQTFSVINGLNYGDGEKIKGYIPTNLIKKVKPNKEYSIVVDKSKQKINIYKKDKLIESFICSTGIGSYETPSGRFLIGDRGAYFTGKGYVCYNWMRINNNYLFHSVLCYPNSENPIPYEYNRLGYKASHGCIRVKQEDIKWMYNSIPRGTLVVIK